AARGGYPLLLPGNELRGDRPRLRLSHRDRGELAAPWHSEPAPDAGRTVTRSIGQRRRAGVLRAHRVKCWECEEHIGAAARNGRGPALPDAAERHLVCCASCREFRAQFVAVAPALVDWQAPPAPDQARERVVAACRAAMLERLPAATAPPVSRVY